MADGTLKLQKKFTRVGRSIYLYHDDPLYWEKLLKFEPNNGEALFHVAKNREKEALESLINYKKTKNDTHKNAYLTKMKEVMNLLYQSNENGYELAAREIQNLSSELQAQLRADDDAEYKKHVYGAVGFIVGFALGTWAVVLLTAWLL